MKGFNLAEGLGNWIWGFRSRELGFMTLRLQDLGFRVYFLGPGFTTGLLEEPYCLSMIIIYGRQDDWFGL